MDKQHIARWRGRILKNGPRRKVGSCYPPFGMFLLLFYDVRLTKW